MSKRALAIPSGGILPGLGLGLKVAAFLQVSTAVATTLVTAAVAGFINASIQGVMAGFGIREFSIAEVITAAFAAGSAGWIQEAAAAVTNAPSAEATLLLFAKAASVNIAEQVMLLSIGQQLKFDFAQATTAALGAIADARLAKYTGNMHHFPRALAHTTTGALVTGAMQKGMDLEQLAAQLVASTVMHAAAPAVMQGVQWVNNNISRSAASASPTPVQQPVKTGAKKQANASKHNIHDSERKHHSPAMSQEDFMDTTPMELLLTKRVEPPASIAENPDNNRISTLKASFWQTVDMVNAAGNGFASGLAHAPGAMLEGGVGLVKGVWYFAWHPINSTTTLASGVKHLYDHPEIIKNHVSSSVNSFWEASIVEKSGMIGRFAGDLVGGGIAGGFVAKTGTTLVSQVRRHGFFAVKNGIKTESAAIGFFAKKIPAKLSKIEITEETITHLLSSKLHVTHEMTMSKNAFRRLVSDIKQHGIQEPVKYVEHGGQAYIVDGHHRVAAARQLGITDIPVKKVELPYAGYKTTQDLDYYGPNF